MISGPKFGVEACQERESRPPAAIASRAANPRIPPSPAIGPSAVIESLKSRAEKLAGAPRIPPKRAPRSASAPWKSRRKAPAPLLAGHMAGVASAWTENKLSSASAQLLASWIGAQTLHIASGRRHVAVVPPR